jgi:hypothetical protein
MILPGPRVLRSSNDHCCSGLLASKYRWHGSCPVHGCKGARCSGGSGGWHPQERDWSTVSGNLVMQAACRCFASTLQLILSYDCYLVSERWERSTSARRTWPCMSGDPSPRFGRIEITSIERHRIHRLDWTLRCSERSRILQASSQLNCK